jgi:hypothetical protein
MTAPRPMLTPAVIVTLCPSHAPSPIMTGAAFAMPCLLAGRPRSVKAWSWSPMCTPRATSTSLPSVTDATAEIVMSPANEQPSPTVIVPPIAFSQHPEPSHAPAPIVMSRSPSSRSGGAATDRSPQAAKLRRIIKVNSRALTRRPSR